jgi:hypothetical protein
MTELDIRIAETKGRIQELRHLEKYEECMALETELAELEKLKHEL